MSNTTKNDSAQVWDNYLNKTAELVPEGYSKAQIRVIASSVAKGCTPAELAYFLNVCKSVNLNPFNKEVWCYKDHKGNLIIFTGRDGYLKRAQTSPEFDGLQSEVVYKNDKVFIDAGTAEVRHSFNPTEDRGEIIGAWAKVKRKGGGLPAVVFEPYKDHKGSDKTVWGRDPRAMICKVAEARVLKKQFGMGSVQLEYDFNFKDDTAWPKNKTNELPEEASRAIKHIRNATSWSQLKQVSERLREEYPEVQKVYEEKCEQFLEQETPIENEE